MNEPVAFDYEIGRNCHGQPASESTFSALTPGVTLTQGATPEEWVINNPNHEIIIELRLDLKLEDAPTFTEPVTEVHYFTFELIPLSDGYESTDLEEAAILGT